MDSPPVRVPAEADLNLIEVSREGPNLLHDQVAAEIRRAIADGEAQPGERLPQAKDLAAVLGVNTNTVLRALRTLRDEGLVEMGRGKTTRVTGSPGRSVLITKANELLDLARHHGLRRSDLVNLIHELPG
jgi:GntR family transcriptional regulator